MVACSRPWLRRVVAIRGRFNRLVGLIRGVVLHCKGSEQQAPGILPRGAKNHEWTPLMECCLRMRKDGRRGSRLPSSRLVEMPGIEPGSRKVQHERLQACSAPPVSPVASSADRVGNGPAEVGVLTPLGARIGVSTPHSKISVARSSPLGEGARRT